ncbi:MFS transporter [Spirillospora sp. NPDC127200]
MNAAHPAAVPSAPQRVPRGLVALAFLAVLLDGFDMTVLALLVPGLARDWGLAPADFTGPLVITNVGAVLGYLASSALIARTGARRTLLIGVAVFAIGTVATAAVLPAESLAALGALRLATGLGLGVVLPAAVSLVTTHSPARRRETVSVLVTLGLASGATLAGLLGGRLAARIGADGLFWIAGLCPLVLLAVLWWRLPRTVPAAATTAENTPNARVGALFAPATRTRTVLIWAFSFFIFIASYTLQSWLPTLLTDYGFTPEQAPLGVACTSIGGVLGGLTLAPMATRIGINRALVVMPLVGAVCLTAVALAPVSGAVLLAVLSIGAAGITASQIGQLTLAVALYPAASRATGVSWAAALGRIGSIVGPGAAGVLLMLSLDGRRIMLATMVPVVAALLCALAMTARPAGRAAETADPSPARAS